MAADLRNPFAAAALDRPTDGAYESDRGDARRRTAHEDRLSVRMGFRSREERRTVLAWLDAGLRPGRPGRLASEYPFLLDAGSPARHFTLFAGGLPCAHCVLLPRRIALPGGVMQLAFLSLVYSDPAARGRGHARRVVRAAVRFARDSRIGLVLLWSEADELYAREGFEPAGGETFLELDTTILERALEESQPRGARAAPLPLTDRSVAVGPPRACDWEAIEAIRSQRPARILCEPPELASRPGLPNLGVRVARHADGRLLGFAMRGRGDDLQQVIHEWGGELAATLRCCRALMGDGGCPPSLSLLTPSFRTELGWLCRRAGARVRARPLAWMRIASAAGLAEDLVRLGLDADWLGLREVLEIGDADASPSTPRFHWPSRPEWPVVAQGRILALLFGSPGEPVSGADANALCPSCGPCGPCGPGATPALPLPLPFFVWGLESI